MAKKCSVTWDRVKADYRAHERSTAQLQSAQSRRNKLMIWGHVGPKRDKAIVKAEAAIKQAIAQVKTTYAKFERSEKAYYSCQKKAK